jgi:hypothetical protein
MEGTHVGWMLFDERLEESEFLCAGGKALFLCQHFEAICKEIVMWLSLSKALEQGEFELMTGPHLEFVDKLHGLLLGQSIGRLKKEFGDKLESGAIRVIEGARDARNYVCHESLRDLVFAPSGRGYRFEPDTELLRAKVQLVAEGDYLVSRWSYELLEKKSGWFVDRSEYVQRIEEWVLEGILGWTPRGR